MQKLPRAREGPRHAKHQVFAQHRADELESGRQRLVFQPAGDRGARPLRQVEGAAEGPDCPPSSKPTCGAGSIAIIAMPIAVLDFMGSQIIPGPLQVAASVAPPQIQASTANSSLPHAREVGANRQSTTEGEATSF